MINEEKDLRDLYHRLIDYYTKTGIISEVQTFTEFSENHPDCSFLMNTDTDGLASIQKRLVLINDRKSQSEQFFTLMHELGHIVTGTNDERIADEIATALCQTVEALTGIQIGTAA